MGVQMSFHVLGVDPGLANMGLALISVHHDADTDPSIGFKLVAYRSVTTKPTPKKRRPYAHDDLMRRWQELGVAFTKFAYGRWRGELAAVVMESVSFVRNSSTMCGIGGAYGMVMAYAQVDGIPILQVRPQELKEHLCGQAGTNKGQVFDAIQERFGYPAMMEEEDFVCSDHVADAVAVAVTAVERSELLRAAVRAQARS